MKNKIFIINFYIFFNFFQILMHKKLHLLDIDFILNNSNLGKKILLKIKKINENKNEIKLKEKKIKKRRK